MPEHRKRAFGAARALALRLIVFAVASGASGLVAQAEMVYRRGEISDVATFDPQKTSTVVEADVLFDLFEGLLTFDADGRLVPGAAESWSASADGLVYTFKLRQAQWSNGEPLRADDFVFSLRRLLDPATGAQYANLYYPIKNARAINQGAAAKETLGVKALDERMLEITLEAPTPSILAILAHQTAVPVNPANVEKFGASFMRPGNLVSNGAFRLEAFTPNDETVLVRNPYFHDAAAVKIDREVFLPLEDRAAAFRRFRAGEIDSYPDAPADQIDFVRKTLKDEFHTAPNLGTFYFAFNTQKAPFDNADLRNALSMVVDREFLADKIWGQAMTPAYAFVPPGIDNYRGATMDFRDLAPIDREEKARALLKTAGVSDSHPLKIEIRFNNSENNKATAIAVAQMWKALGVETTFVNADLKSHYGFLQGGGDFDVARAGWIGDYADADNFLFLARSENKKLNYSRYRSPEFDAALNAANRERDPAERAAKLARAEGVLLRDSPIMPLLFYNSKNMVSARVKGWRSNLLDHHLARYLSIAP